MMELAEQVGLPASDPPAITPHWARVLREGGRPPSDAPRWLKHYRFDEKKPAALLRPGYVWHCPVRLHPDDPMLSDQQWEHIAGRLMTASGIDPAGCRWIAVRHRDDHIHLMATLVSERDGKRHFPYREWPRLRKECQELEREYGLVGTAGADKTAQQTPTRREKGKAQRLGRTLTPIEELQRVVAQIAASVRNGDEFLEALSQEGLNPRVSRDAKGRVRGYAVSLPGDLTAARNPVTYSGTKLAADLTWPKLTARWADTPPVPPPARTEDGRVAPADRRAVLEQAAQVIDRAAAQVRGDLGDADVIAHATGEVLAALARGLEGRELGPLANAADRYDRAARTPHRVLPSQLGAVARELRYSSRRIAAAGALSGRGREKFAVLGCCWRCPVWSRRSRRGSSSAAAYAKRPLHATPPARYPGQRAQPTRAAVPCPRGQRRHRQWEAGCGTGR